MASPFQAAPTLQEFIEKAIQYHGWKRRHCTVPVTHEGEVSNPEYLENKAGEVVTFHPDELKECLSPGQIAYYSRKLAMPLTNEQKIMLEELEKEHSFKR